MGAAARLLFSGGLTSYRALFGWISPWILIPTFLVEPVFQVLFFVYIGRAAGAEDDAFFLIGNAIQFSSVPCLFAMANTIDGERRSGTLSLLLASPARRTLLFVGRALPVIVTGFAVSLFTLLAGSLVLGVSLPARSLAPLVLVLCVTAFSCTGLGLATAAVALRVRQAAVLSNIMVGLLLIFSGANVPMSALPPWMAAVSRELPLTHGIVAARHLAGNTSGTTFLRDLATEAAVGVAYLVVGLLMLRVFEAQSRRHATLDLS